MSDATSDKKPDKATFMADAQKYLDKFGIRHSKFPTPESYLKYVGDMYDITISPMSDSQWKMYYQTQQKTQLPTGVVRLNLSSTTSTCKS